MIEQTGVYLLTNDNEFELLYNKLACLLESDCIEVLQYRRKKIVNLKQKQHEINQLKKLCDKYAVTFVINDDVALAKQFASGVHLGQGDGSLLSAREQLGTSAFIGSTCHSSIQLAVLAEQQLASYVAFGAYRPSQTKPNAAVINENLLLAAAQELSLPICVIGGVTLDDIVPLRKKGVRYVAMVNALLDGSLQDVEQRSSWLVEAFKCSNVSFD